MLINRIPYHLRNTVEFLDLPIYVDLRDDLCLPPPNLALGDTLMVLGLIRNLGRPVRLCMDPGLARELVESHPLVKEVLPPDQEAGGLEVKVVPVARSGRQVSWRPTTNYRLKFPVLPVDRVRANPCLAHSLYHKLDNCDDRPSLFLDPDRPAALAHLASSARPLCVVYPFNPTRTEHIWQDVGWWWGVCNDLKKDFFLVAVGAEDYGKLAEVVDQTLPMSDAASTLPDLAWLISKAKVFLGRDGGLYHLAAAVNPNLVVLWDSMASYRYWAGQAGHHILMSNPYGFRYPQTMRVNTADLLSSVRRFKLQDAQGGWREVDLPDENTEKAAVKIFGDIESYRQAAICSLEVEEDRRGLRAWEGKEKNKKAFYQQSQSFAIQAVKGNVPTGRNWVAPVFP